MPQSPTSTARGRRAPTLTGATVSSKKSLTGCTAGTPAEDVLSKETCCYQDAVFLLQWRRLSSSESSQEGSVALDWNRVATTAAPPATLCLPYHSARPAGLEVPVSKVVSSRPPAPLHVTAATRALGSRTSISNKEESHCVGKVIHQQERALSTQWGQETMYVEPRWSTQKPGIPLSQGWEGSISKRSDPSEMKVWATPSGRTPAHAQELQGWDECRMAGDRGYNLQSQGQLQQRELQSICLTSSSASPKEERPTETTEPQLPKPRWRNWTENKPPRPPSAGSTAGQELQPLSSELHLL